MSIYRIAVMVDGDNVSPVHAARILAAATKLGRVDVARVYASGAQPTDWFGVAGYRAMHAGAGKNSTDILLSIDAMELALRDEIRTFVLATSDGDFSHLAHRLREKGLHVLGMGDEKAPDGFRLACSEFTILKRDKPATPKVVKPDTTTKTILPPTQKPQCQATDLDRKIRVVIGQNSLGGMGMRIASLGAQMSTKHGVLISKTPDKSCLAYLIARPALYDVDPRGPEAMVRYLMDGFTTRSLTAPP